MRGSVSCDRRSIGALPLAAEMGGCGDGADRSVTSASYPSRVGGGKIHVDRLKESMTKRGEVP